MHHFQLRVPDERGRGWKKTEKLISGGEGRGGALIRHLRVNAVLNLMFSYRPLLVNSGCYCFGTAKETTNIGWLYQGKHYKMRVL